MRPKTLQRIGALLIVPAAWFASLGTSFSQSEVRSFSSPDGKTIKAQILGATESAVKLKLDGGRELDAAITAFSKADQDYIAEWRATNKPAVKYGFDVQYKRKRTEKEKRNEGAVVVTYEKWLYEVTVENESDSDLSGLELHYKIYKSAKADASEAMYRGEGLTREGDYLVMKGKVDLGTLQRLKSSTVQTGGIPLSQSQLDGNFYYIDGDKSNKKDELDGAWFKIFHDGKEVHEVKSSHAAVKNAKW